MITLTNNIVTQLIEDQFSDWRDFEIKPFQHAGSDNAMFRLGASHCIRLPLTECAENQLQLEQKYLSKLSS